MVIVFVVDYFNSTTDGTIITALRFHDELINRGHTVRVVSYGVQGENKFGLKEHYIPFVSEVSKKFNVTYAKYDENVLKKAYEGADLVHLFLPFQLQRKALKLAKRMGVPVTAAFHVHPQNMLKNGGIKNSKMLSDFIFWYFRKSFYDKVEYIHCPSEFTKNELVNHNYKSKFYVISNGVSPFFVPSEKKIVNNKEKFKILMIGRLAAEKRQDLLIEAVKASKYKDQIEITFAGNGPLQEKLEKQSKSLKNKPVFGFFKQEELREEIYKADLYVHAADVEIEGISCMEALSCGLVPLISDAPLSASKQFAIDEKCIFQAGNKQNLKDKIEFFIENPLVLHDLSKKYVEFSKQFTLENSVKKAEEMFFECLNSSQNHSKNGKNRIFAQKN